MSALTTQWACSGCDARWTTPQPYAERIPPPPCAQCAQRGVTTSAWMARIADVTPERGPFSIDPRRIVRFSAMPSGNEYRDSIVAQDDDGALWVADICYATNGTGLLSDAMRWQRLPALPTYDEVPR